MKMKLHIKNILILALTIGSMTFGATGNAATARSRSSTGRPSVGIDDLVVQEKFEQDCDSIITDALNSIDLDEIPSACSGYPKGLGLLYCLNRQCDQHVIYSFCGTVRNALHDYHYCLPI